MLNLVLPYFKIWGSVTPNQEINKQNLQGFSTFSIRPLSTKHRKINGKIRMSQPPLVGCHRSQRLEICRSPTCTISRWVVLFVGFRRVKVWEQVLTRKPRQHPFFTIFEPNELYINIYICLFIYLIYRWRFPKMRIPQNHRYHRFQYSLWAKFS